MLSSTFALAPAGVVGSGPEGMRPYAGTAVRPSVLRTAAVLGGTRVPTAGTARRRNAEDIAGLAGELTAAAAQHDPISTKNDGTTPLGIHPRGRSTS